METSLPYQIDENSSTDSPNLPHDFTESPRQDDALLTTTKELRSILAATEEHLVELQQQKDELAKQNLDLVNVIVEIKAERDAIQREIEEVGESQDELVKKSDDESRERFEIQNKLDVSQERIEGFLRSLDLVGSVKECLIRVLKKMGKENSENVSEEGFVLDEKDELKKFLSQMMFVYKLASKTEEGFVKCEEMRRKEKRELENSVVSLTEENRDINSLLRIALVEKEAGEKAISRLKGNGEQKRVALLQIAERGLQKVGFGFMRSAPTGDSLDNLGSKSDSSECDEEVVSLASMVEKMMKNLRIEITQLRRSLEESRYLFAF
ncbi:hypothetical protein GIB67_022781 [Kingdonia uniflora]|uniref:Uncharacterized protein n=1 Tax=Kingdonia uniflora TaxID=39325 RepID=A0A7J7P6Y2_9MAGN|nr:hypothetical protein GIB67_022781 [Kingdonia uniflora]